MSNIFDPGDISSSASGISKPHIVTKRYKILCIKFSALNIFALKHVLCLYLFVNILKI